MAEGGRAAVEAAPERVAELFERLADLSPAEAERRLLLECQGDLALARTVRALLACDREAEDDFLAPVAAEVWAPSSDRPSDRTPELSPSSRLGRYHLLDKVGEGGMGSVYLGYDQELDRRVALKVVRGAARREWLRREGQALARLAHPNVIGIYEVGEQDGIVFLAMELVEGTTLRAWLEREPRSFTEILRLFRQAGRGLVAVHRAGLVHRDFKPDNVLVGADGRAKVADFGLAALASRGAEEAAAAPAAEPSANLLEQQLTQHGLLFGTPAYMAPELLAGARATLASDQWSFAVALYRAVYGLSPYPPEAWRSGEVRAPVVPPRRAGVPAWLWPILATGLAYEASRRFASVDELLGAIDAHVPSDPELDPTVVVDERRRLTVIFALGYLAHSIALLVPPAAEAILRPSGLVAFPLGCIALVAVVLSTRSRHHTRNRYGRRLALQFLGFPFALLLHRVLCLRLGLGSAQVLALDSFCSAVVYAALAREELRWLLWLAAFNLLEAGGAAAAPERASLVVAAGGLLTVAAVGVRVFLDRHLDATTALGAIKRDEERRG